MEKQIILTARLSAKKGKEARLREILESMLSPSRSEAGCVQYTLHVLKEDPATFLFYEVWKDQAAFDTHSATPHFRERKVGAAREIFPNTFWPRDGETVSV